jgi:hypothetical protein
MITVKEEQEHYCLVTDDRAWTVVERRAGKYYALGVRRQPGVSLDQPEAAALFRPDRCYPEPAARRLLAVAAEEWRYLAEHLR